MTRQAQGHDVLIAFGKETTQGTAPAASVFKSWGIVNEFETEINKNNETLRSLGSRTVQMYKDGQLEVSNTLGMYLQDPKIFYYALGKSTASGTSGAYSHEVTSVGRCEELPTFTVQDNICISGTPLITNYSGSKIDTLTVSGSAGELIEVEAEIVSTKWQDGATPAASYDTILNTVYSFAEGIITINGANVAVLKEFEVEIANNLEGLYTITKGNGPSMINEGVQDITGSLTFALTDLAQHTLFKNGSEFNVYLRFDNPTDAADSIELKLANAKYDAESISKSSDSELDLEIDALFKTVSVTCKSKTIADLTT